MPCLILCCSQDSMETQHIDLCSFLSDLDLEAWQRPWAAFTVSVSDRLGLEPGFSWMFQYLHLLNNQ